MSSPQPQSFSDAAKEIEEQPASSRRDFAMDRLRKLIDRPPVPYMAAEQRALERLVDCAGLKDVIATPVAAAVKAECGRLLPDIERTGIVPSGTSELIQSVRFEAQQIAVLAALF